jgi:hypothetical protein
MSWGTTQGEHDCCIVEVASEYFSRGYDVYLEHEIPLNTGKRKRLVVDILAIKDQEKIVIEVGTLSYQCHGLMFPEDRIFLLKQVLPNTKVIHITQWKNYISQFDWRDAEEDYRFKKYLSSKQAKEDMISMGKSLIHGGDKKP